MERARRVLGLTLAIWATAAVASAADQQVRLFVGTTFAGDTSFVDLENAAGSPHFTLGGQLAWLGEIFGVDFDFADTGGFFEGGGSTKLVIKSRVTTWTGDVVVALPRRLSEYSLRLYFVGGGGIMRVREEDSLAVYDITEVKPAVNVGVGALGFLSNRVGLSWELRRFQLAGPSSQLRGITVGGSEHLTYWRAHMAVVIRY
jgi:hypothetical protein